MNSNLKWICDELTESLILILYNKNSSKYAGSYEANKIIKINEDDIVIEDANISDIQDFLLYGIIRFMDTEHNNEIIDIPVRKLILLYSNMSNTFSNEMKFIELDKLDAFVVERDRLINEGYGIIAVSAYLEDKYLEINKDLLKIMNIAFRYKDMDMQEKFNAIKEVNEILNMYE